MSEDIAEETPSIQEWTEKGREKLAQAQTGAKDALSAVADYTRANPWIAIAGAAVLGGVVVALTKPARKPESRLDVIRDWLDDMYAKLPSQKQVQSAVEASGVPDFLGQVRKKLHFN
jgi:hypothetical protein